MKQKVDELLTAAFKFNASDVHLTVGVPPIFRINGDLKRYGTEPLKPDDTKEMAYAMLTKQLAEKFEKQKEIDFSYGIPKVSRFRVNAYYQRNCVSLAIRIIPRSIPTLRELNMPLVLEKIASYPQGLVLVTGPTGSGKSTTLAAMIHHMNQTMRRHIITLEDPIEYLHKHNYCIIDQREIGFDTNTFASGLRAALRQDPDVILVGELRDLETISTAITAAETGHLVLGTLHTTDAASTVDRIIDVFPPSQQQQIRAQLASVLSAIISQRLFPRADQKGRVAATEILINNPAVENLIRSEKTHQIPTILQTSKALGMHTLQMSILDLIQQNLITKDVARPYLDERDRG